MESVNVSRKINSYPVDVREYANKIRSLIHETAGQEGIFVIEESLKWGQPSFDAVDGSPIRMDWSAKTPDNFYIFFNCKTILIETLRELYGTALKFEGNRAIVLELSEKVPTVVLQHCISLALKYHRLKKFPLLGA